MHLRRQQSGAALLLRSSCCWRRRCTSPGSSRRPGRCPSSWIPLLVAGSPPCGTREPGTDGRYQPAQRRANRGVSWSTSALIVVFLRIGTVERQASRWSRAARSRTRLEPRAEYAISRGPSRGRSPHQGFENRNPSLLDQRCCRWSSFEVSHRWSGSEVSTVGLRAPRGAAIESRPPTPSFASPGFETRRLRPSSTQRPVPVVDGEGLGPGGRQRGLGRRWSRSEVWTRLDHQDPRSVRTTTTRSLAWAGFGTGLHPPRPSGWSRWSGREGGRSKAGGDQRTLLPPASGPDVGSHLTGSRHRSWSRLRPSVAGLLELARLTRVLVPHASLAG